MTPDEMQAVIRQYQQWLANAQLEAATLAAQLATAQEQNTAANRRIAELETPASPKPAPPRTGTADA
ncbi:hypothetical protein ACSYDW_01390 [Paeniglutamicibacter sp. R2-26]|uniref:hypothetical protein n=1 Tax=Paeniglutamicibacter sp. R2-26 TaxID=3144417 RepID=UPI003EE7B0E0